MSIPGEEAGKASSEMIVMKMSLNQSMCSCLVMLNRSSTPRLPVEEATPFY